MLELMMVVAVIAVLAMIALPSYQGRIARQQVEAAWPLADLAKRPIAASWGATQTFPADNAAAELPAADKMVNNYVSAVSVQDGTINITYGNRANAVIAGKILSIRPAVVDDSPIVPVAWVCGKADPPKKMTASGVDRTTVPAAVLPIECRKLTP